MEEVFLEFSAVLERHEDQCRLAAIGGEAFYQRVRDCFAVIASSERRLYGNIVLRKGVICL
jgi:L-fucose mutarotase